MSKIMMPEGRKAKATPKIPLAKRPTTLKGKKIALYHNDKTCSYPVLRKVKELLEKKLGVTDFFEVHSGQPFSRHPESSIKEALKADAIFLSAADWGSCTAWLLDAAVRIEKGGKPTVLLAAEMFRQEVINHSKMDGIPYLPFVAIEYQQNDKELIPAAVEKSFDGMVKAVTMLKEDLEKKANGEL